MADAFVRGPSDGFSGPDLCQIDAAVLGSPISKGVILADEFSLGKTIEASLVTGTEGALPAALCKD